MNKFKVALIGLGRIGFSLSLEKTRKLTWSHSEAIDKSKKLKLIYAVDKDKNKINKFKEKYKNVIVQKNLNFDQNIDCLVIAVKECCLLDILKKINLKKIKLIVLEKPVARSTNEYNKIYSHLKKNKSKVIVNYQRRFDKNYNFLKTVIKKKKFGNLKSINVRYSGGLFNIFSHMLDTIIMLTNTNPENVSFVSNNKTTSDFSAEGHIVLKNNVICTVNSISNGNNLVFDMYLIFDKGIINVTETTSSLTIYKLEKSLRFNNYKEFYLRKKIVSNCDSFKELYYYIEKVLSKKTNYYKYKASNIKDSEKIIRTLCCIKKSVQKSGKIIKIN
jgi:predicted dehydrogenase